MTPLVFKNQKLQGILKITELSNVFRATYDEAIDAYEADTGLTYEAIIASEVNAGLKHSAGQIPDKYYQHNIPKVWLVKDEGIYLMTAAKMEQFPIDKSHICYAEGFEPDSPDCWERSRSAVGGDDFVESFEFNDELRKGIKQGADMLIEIDEESFVVKLVFLK